MHTVFGKWGLGKPISGRVLWETKSFLLCGSGAENNSVQTLSCAVSLRKDKAGDVINKQQFWSIDSTPLNYFMQKWIVSALGIIQQTGLLTLLFLCSQYQQITF